MIPLGMIAVFPHVYETWEDGFWFNLHTVLSCCHKHSLAHQMHINPQPKIAPNKYAIST